MNKNRQKTNKQQGAAIIVALFIMALIAAAAITMMQLFRTDLRRTELISQAIQSDFYAQGSIAWAMDTLNQDWKQRKPNQITDKTPITAVTGHEGPYTISGVITDSQGLLNINNLSDARYQALFIRLLQLTTPKIETATAQEIVKAIVDWITPGLKETPFDQYYLKLNPPYRSAHRLMMSISELLLVKGVTTDIFSALEPYITALPTPTPININNAPDKVLMSLSPSITIDTAKNIENSRITTPFTDINHFNSIEGIKNNPVPADMLTILSNYFLLETNVRVGEQQTILYTLLNRQSSNSQSKVLIVWQSKGTL